MKQKTWSFSKLNSFHNCKYEWYRKYVLHERGRDSVYGLLGGCFHECLENMFKGEMTIEEAIEKFDSEFEYCEFMDINFPTEKSKINYKKAIDHYLENYEPYPSEYEYKTEMHFVFEPIEGIRMQGYIDLIQIDKVNKTMRVIDYKTSSKFSKSELYGEKVMQLILYSMYLEEMYPDYTILNACFDMAKYTKNKRGTMIDRSLIDELMDDFDYKRYLLEIEYNQEMKDKLIEYIKNNVEEISKMNTQNEEEWTPNCNSFYCKNLCAFGDCCKHFKK